MSQNEYAERARVQKAWNLAAAFERSMKKIWPAEMGPFDITDPACAKTVAEHAARALPQVWFEVADQNGIRPPSAETVAATIVILEKQAERAGENVFDLFEMED